MADYYRQAHEQNEDLEMALNTLNIERNKQKIAYNNRWLPEAALESTGEQSYGRIKNENFRGNSIGVEASLKFAIHSVPLSHALKRADKSVDIAKARLQDREQEFTYQFAREILLISQKKTRYYFAKEEADFLDDYYNKRKEEEKASYAELHPNEVFNENANFALRNIAQNKRSQQRQVAKLLEDLKDEVAVFEIAFLKREMPKYIMVNPFQKRAEHAQTLNHDIVVAVQENLGIKTSQLEIASAQVDAEFSAKIPWSLNLGSSVGVEKTQMNSLRDNPANGSTGIFFSLPLNTSRRERKREAELRISNEEISRQKLINDVTIELRKLRNALEYSVGAIDTLLDDYAESKTTLSMFLRPNHSETAKLSRRQEMQDSHVSSFEKREIVEIHFQVARNLAEAQHDYLLAMLGIRRLQNKLDLNELIYIEEKHFKECKDFAAFLGLGEDFLSNYKPGQSPVEVHDRR